MKRVESWLKRPWLMRVVRLWAISAAILLASMFSNVLSNYNFIEIFPRELVFPVAMNLVTGLLVALVVSAILRRTSMAAQMIAAIVLTLFMLNYDTRLSNVAGALKALFPFMPNGDTLPAVSLVFLLILVGLSVGTGLLYEWLQRRFGRPAHKNVAAWLMIVVAFLFVSEGLRLATILPTMIREAKVQAAPFKAPKASVSSTPDIYYIVTDRYANAKVLKDQFSYDNTSFNDFLRGDAFFVNDDAFSNYPHTTMSIASTINAQYTAPLVAPFKNGSIQDRTLNHNLIQQGAVIRALKAAGYSYTNIGSQYGASYRAPLADNDVMSVSTLRLGAREKKLRGIEASMLSQTPYYQFLLNAPAWSPFKLWVEDGVPYLRHQLQTLNDLADNPQQGGRFIFAHMIIPHEPFLLNADGSENPFSGVDNVGKPVKEKYTGQVQFINSQLKELFQKIIDHSGGKAVVVLNADEGPYPQYMNSTFLNPTSVAETEPDGRTTRDDMRTWSDDWLKMKFGIEQAVHIPNATAEDMQHLSSVNIFRIVLDRYLGYSLPLLPDCHYGLTVGSNEEFLYADITQRLKGNDPAMCKQLQSQR